MRTIKLIKNFEFQEKNRERITLGPNVRLVANEHKVQLKDTNGVYPIDPDLYVKTWVANPINVKQWLLFESVIAHWYDDDGSPITSDGYRLGDGTDEYWWDGGDWVINNTSWNTEQEICDNINTFPVSSLKLQVIVNLVTTDSEYTPVLYSVKVLYSSSIEFKEDLIYRSLIPALKEGIRPIADYPVKLSADSDTIDLKNDFPLRTPYNVVEIDSVFDNNSDPNHLLDLYSSYDYNAQVITMTTTLSAGTVVWIKLIYEPEVAITTKRTYNEIGKVPVLVISDYNNISSKEGQGSETVMNKATGVGTKVHAPLMLDIEFVLRCLTDKARDQVRLTDMVKSYFRRNPVLWSKGLDEPYRLWLIDEIDHQNPLGESEIDSARLRFRIANALFYNRGDEVAYAVKRFVVQGPPNLIV